MKIQPWGVSSQIQHLAICLLTCPLVLYFPHKLAVVLKLILVRPVLNFDPPCTGVKDIIKPHLQLDIFVIAPIDAKQRMSIRYPQVWWLLPLCLDLSCFFIKTMSWNAHKYAYMFQVNNFRCGMLVNVYWGVLIIYIHLIDWTTGQ